MALQGESIADYAAVEGVIVWKMPQMHSGTRHSMFHRKYRRLHSAAQF